MAAPCRLVGTLSSPLSRCALAALAVLSASSLQGCDLAGSQLPSWDGRPSFLLDFQYLPVQLKRQGGARASPSQAVLNSCEVDGLAPELRCNGNGVCRRWNANSSSPNAISFCECDRDWADPECRTRRKSQATAFLLSLFGGYLGLDRFYLGEYASGVGKLATLGGLGGWWLFDVVRLGSAPVYAADFRLAADLPHWVYVALSIGFFALLGYLVLGVGIPDYRRKRREVKLLLQAEAEFHKTRRATLRTGSQDMVGMPTKASYHVPAPPGGVYGTMAPHEARASSYGNPLSSFAVYEGVAATAARQWPAGSWQQVGQL